MKERAIILVDVGGTNSRVYSFDKDSCKERLISAFKPKSIIELKSKLKKILEEEVENRRSIHLYACFAGVVLKEKNIASVTKWNEKFKISDFYKFLNVENGTLLNDARAAILGLNYIRDKVKADFIMGCRNNKLRTPFSLLYLGTGLGSAYFDSESVSSELCSIPMPLNEKERDKLKLKNDILIEDLVSGKGLSLISRILYGKSLNGEDVSQKIFGGQMKMAGKFFAKYLGRAAKLSVLSFPSKVVFIGGKPTKAFTKIFYNEFIKEFLSDKINSWWLKEVTIAKLDSHLDLPLEGLKQMALLKEK